MEQKHVKHMNSAEQAAELERLKGLAPEPLPPLDVSRQAKNMSDSERAEWLREHKRRFP